MNIINIDTVMFMVQPWQCIALPPCDGEEEGEVCTLPTPITIHIELQTHLAAIATSVERGRVEGDGFIDPRQLMLLCSLTVIAKQSSAFPYSLPRLDTVQDVVTTLCDKRGSL